MDAPPMTPVLELESQIRDFVNAPRRQATIFKDKVAWGMLCSSLDVIGDIEVAVEAYLKDADGHQGEAKNADQLAEMGNLYITIYGILQVLFVQQDAVKHLAESLGLNYDQDPVLKDIRETRNQPSVIRPSEAKGRRSTSSRGIHSQEPVARCSPHGLMVATTSAKSTYRR
jgi:hypothetical protein